MSRPLKFTLQQIDDGIEAYFTYCAIDGCGYPIAKEHKAPTITGLACFLKTTRDLLLDYEKKPKFSDTIKRAKQRIEAYNEYLLLSKSGQVAGVIFNLKNNFNWQDKTEIETNCQDFEPVRVYLPDNNRDPELTQRLIEEQERRKKEK